MEEEFTNNTPEVSETPVDVVPRPAPEVQYVFDSFVAREWMENTNHRLQGVFSSVRFEPDGMPVDQMDFLTGLAARSVKPVYIKKGVPTHGFLWVPTEFSGYFLLLGMTVVGDDGDYIAFRWGE